MINLGTVSALEEFGPGIDLPDLQREVARRLRELRLDRFHGLSPEAVSERAAEEMHLDIGARTIRDCERPDTCNPTIETLHKLLHLYRSSIGDLFRFNASAEHAALVGELLAVIDDAELRKALRVILSRLKPRST